MAPLNPWVVNPMGFIISQSILKTAPNSLFSSVEQYAVIGGVVIDLSP